MAIAIPGCDYFTRACPVVLAKRECPGVDFRPPYYLGNQIMWRRTNDTIENSATKSARICKIVFWEMNTCTERSPKNFLEPHFELNVRGSKFNWVWSFYARVIVAAKLNTFSSPNFLHDTDFLFSSFFLHSPCAVYLLQVARFIDF